MFPKVKKKITGFLLTEEGKISKQSLLTLGSFISAAVIGGVLATKEAAAQHINNLSVSYSGGTATGEHGHHSFHDSAPCDSACTAPCLADVGVACTAAPGGAPSSACTACACACM